MTTEILQHHSQGDFPILDFKFENSGFIADMIIAVEFRVDTVEVDPTPLLEYDVFCEDGNLMLALTNYGWGVARDVSVRLDLPFLKIAPIVPVSEPLRVGDVSPTEKRRFPSPGFLIVDKKNVRADRMPARLMANESWFRNGSWHMTLHGLDPNNLPGIAIPSAEISYADLRGGRVTKNRTAFERDTSRMFFSRTRGFVNVGYSDRSSNPASYLPPSCKYHFLISTDSPTSVYRFSTAHTLAPKEFERLWIVIGADKSCRLKGKVVFITSTGREITSPNLDISLWNPSNSNYHELPLDYHNQEEPGRRFNQNAEVNPALPGTKKISVPPRAKFGEPNEYKSWVDDEKNW